MQRDGFQGSRHILSQIVELSDVEGRETDTRIRETVNLANLRKSVLPTRQRANLTLRKGPDHLINSVYLRKL